nr:GntR family transcriptional regulator [Staphylococcus aureus]
MGNFQYKMIIDDIINKINNGELSSGDKLPSQREISQYYNVNRSTVIQSLDILKSYGILETIEKKKAFMYLNINGMLILQVIFIGKII